MDKVIVVLLLYSCLAISMVSGSIEPHNEVDKWFDEVTKGKAVEKATSLKYYVQDVLTGPNSTVTVVAQGPETDKSPTGFGRLSVVDDLLTETPQPDSKPVGRAQGIIGFCSKEEVALLVAMNFVFTSGEWTGSSLTVLGRNQIGLPVRELPIVGGTGVFRLARGFATVTTYQFNATTIVLEYNVLVIHY